MITKHVNGPEAISSDPVFSTRRFDVFLLSPPGTNTVETHTDNLHVYVAFKRTDDEAEESLPQPACTVYVEHEQHDDGGVLNRIYRCTVIPPLAGALFHPDNVEPLLNRKPASIADSVTAEILFAIQEFAGPVTLVCMDKQGLDHCREFVEELIYEELNDKLLLAAVAAPF